MDGRLTRVGVFIDGGYWEKVRAFHRHRPGRPGPHTLSGLLNFIPKELASLEGIEASHCVISEANYFRGLYSTAELEKRGWLKWQARFDEMLRQLRIEPHYRLMNDGREKGVDTVLTLETYKAVDKRHVDIVALVACDGDFVPLVEEVQRVGARVAIVAWNFHYTDATGPKYPPTRVSRQLTERACYTLRIDDYRDETVRTIDPSTPAGGVGAVASVESPLGEPSTCGLLAGQGGKGKRRGCIESIGPAFGFIRDNQPIGETWYFDRCDCYGANDVQLCVGTEVEFDIGRNYVGAMAVDVTPVQPHYPVQALETQVRAA